VNLSESFLPGLDHHNRRALTVSRTSLLPILESPKMSLSKSAFCHEREGEFIMQQNTANNGFTKNKASPSDRQSSLSGRLESL
jgi:hypothetical protein